MGETRITLTEAAFGVHWTYQRTRDAVLRGILRGGRDAAGKWFVLESDVARLIRERDGVQDGNRAA
jgi:hypothetical protein